MWTWTVSQIPPKSKPSKALGTSGLVGSEIDGLDRTGCECRCGRVYEPNLNHTELIVDEDYRIDFAEKRISDRKRNNDKDKELIKKIKRFVIDIK